MVSSLNEDLFGGRVSQKDLARVRRTMRDAPVELHREFDVMFTTWGEEWHRLMTKQFRPAGKGSRRLGNRTGALRRSLNHRTKGGDLETLKLNAFSAGVPYALSQEFGGTIRSNRPGGYLTIPLDALKTGAGVTREISARDMIKRLGLVGKSKKGQLTFYRNKKGTLLLGKVKADDSIEPLWALVKSITLPGPKSPKGGPSRLGFFRNWERLQKRRSGQLKRATNRALLKARGSSS